MNKNDAKTVRWWRVWYEYPLTGEKVKTISAFPSEAEAKETARLLAASATDAGWSLRYFVVEE